MSTLAHFLEPQLEGLVQRWTHRIAGGLAPEGVSEPVLRDHIADVLRELVVTLRHGSVPDTIVYARKHGKQRYQAGFDLDAMVREYGELRSLILELSEQARLGLTMAEIRLLTDFIAAAIAEAVTEYDQQRARAEQRLSQGLREHEAQLQAVLGSTAEGIWGVDPQGLCTFANPAAVRMLGGSDEADLIGQDMLGRAPSRPGHVGGTSLASALAEVLGTGREVRRDNVPMERLDGTVFPARYIVSPLRRDEQVAGVVITFEDITARQQAENAERVAQAEAEAERRKLHDLFMQAPVPIAILEGPAHTFTLANPSYRVLVGGRDVVGKPVLEALPELQGQGFDTLLDRVVATGEPFVGKEVPVQLDRSGTGQTEEAFLNFTYTPKHDARGSVDGVLVSAADVTEQVQARHRVEALAREVRASAAELRLVLDGLPILVAFVAPDERYALANHTYQDWFGAAPHTLVGRTVRETIGEEAYAVIGPSVRRALTGERFTAEHHDVPYRSGARDVRGTFVPHHDATGAVDGYISFFEDITLQRRWQAERERAQARVTEVLESMGDAFFALDKDWRITLVNRQYERVTGIDRADALGRIFWQEYPEAAHPDGQYFRQYHRCMAERVPVQFIDYYQPLGLWTEVRAYPSADGGIAVFFRDVSRERQIQEALRASEERYRTLFESIDDGYSLLELIVDAQGQVVDYRILETNAAFERQTGLKHATGKRITELLPDHVTPAFALYGHVADTGETARFENHAPAIGDRWFDAYASRVGPPAQRQVAVVFKDITERKRSEQERERLLEELTRSNQDLDQFAHVASHDLRAPLRGIANLAQWIEDDLEGVLTSDARDKLDLMRGRVKRLEALIAGILDFATAGRSQVKPEKVDVGELLTEAIELLAPPAHVAVSVGADMPTLWTERAPLQQVFMNLIGNAIKHTQHPGASIRIEATGEGTSVHFSITDNGPGIAPENHERIWGLFQKLESKAKIEGTGIGLAVVKKLVELRGGRTWVESALGQGATFHVTWPTRSPEAASPPSSWKR